jgi:hypothetical protein
MLLQKDPDKVKEEITSILARSSPGGATKIVNKNTSAGYAPLIKLVCATATEWEAIYEVHGQVANDAEMWGRFKAVNFKFPKGATLQDKLQAAYDNDWLSHRYEDESWLKDKGVGLSKFATLLYSSYTNGAVFHSKVPIRYNNCDPDVGHLVHNLMIGTYSLPKQFEQAIKAVRALRYLQENIIYDWIPVTTPAAAKKESEAEKISRIVEWSHMPHKRFLECQAIKSKEIGPEAKDIPNFMGSFTEGKDVPEVGWWTDIYKPGFAPEILNFMPPTKGGRGYLLASNNALLRMLMGSWTAPETGSMLEWKSNRGPFPEEWTSGKGDKPWYAPLNLKPTLLHNCHVLFVCI